LFVGRQLDEYPAVATLVVEGLAMAQAMMSVVFID